MFFDEILCAPSTEALLLGLYEQAVPALVRALERMMADTNRLFDHPSWRIYRLTLVEVRDIEQYGTEAIGCMVSAGKRAELQPWLNNLGRMWPRQAA